MVTMYDDSSLETTEDIRKFLGGSHSINFRPLRRKERSEWIRNLLVRFKYLVLKRPDKKLVRKYIMKISGLSRAQTARHVKAYAEKRPICVPYKRYQPFQIYARSDTELLAETDDLHSRLNGAAAIAIMRKEYKRGDCRYVRLKDISVSHLYRLRGAKKYRECSMTYEKTKHVQTPIGERRKPRPNGQPGFLRIDSVHQGDCNGEKGVYHINPVDEVTQWEVPVAVETLKETCVETALDEMFQLFPFDIGNFHSDNGGEYINGIVHQFLQRWNVKQTKSRPRHSNDNSLAETKNGAIIRKHMTYHHIPQPFAARINKFYREHLIPYLNFHRPCAFPKVEIQPDGRKNITYPKENYKTPYEKLKSLPNWEQYLRTEITPEILEKQANAKTPNEAARDMQKAKKELLDIVIPKHSDIL